MNREQVREAARIFKMNLQEDVDNGVVTEEEVNALFKEMFYDDVFKTEVLSEFAPDREFYMNTCSIKIIEMQEELDDIVHQLKVDTHNSSAGVAQEYNFELGETFVLHAEYDYSHLTPDEFPPGTQRISGNLQVVVLKH